nr:hypothetical protein L203_00904 [Cryptococcus depauperatus CBS 7841]
MQGAATTRPGYAPARWRRARMINDGRQRRKLNGEDRSVGMECPPAGEPKKERQARKADEHMKKAGVQGKGGIGQQIRKDGVKSHRQNEFRKCGARQRASMSIGSDWNSYHVERV